MSNSTSTENKVLQRIIEDAWNLSPEMGATVDEVIAIDPDPVDDRRLADLLTRVVKAITATPEFAEDRIARNELAAGVDAFVTRVMDEQSKFTKAVKKVTLEGRDNVEVGPVFPTPVFHKREVQMNKGFVRAEDIDLWDGNERLEIHLAQYRRENGRNPTAGELLEIMLCVIKLPGIDVDDQDDQFEILALARSIAASGVRVPPIIDVDGTLLDGNRRVAACMLILRSHNAEFTFEEKQRAEWVFVHQLTVHAVDADREAVVVSCNFEPDNKVDWPEYVKARKVSEAWQEVLALSPALPNKREQATMKKELSKRFGLGPDTTVVNRYLKMVQWADAFEIHEVSMRGRDQFEAKHRASKYFQYFDELAKGQQPGGVAYTLENDDKFRAMVFDLLFDGKFKNWRQIRDLKVVHTNEDAMVKMQEAIDTTDIEDGQDALDMAVSIARMAQAANRELGANTRIEQFTKFLRDLPVAAFTDSIRPENLRRLRDTLKIVDVQAKAVLGDID